MTTVLVRFSAAADVHWTYEPARSNSGWGVKDHICSRREHGRLDVPSMLTMSYINRSYFSSVGYCCLCATIAASNAPPDTEKSSFLTSLFGLYQHDRSHHRARDVDLELELQPSLPADYHLIRQVPNIRALNIRHISLGDLV